MAEAVATAASVAGLASLAIQLAESAVTLRRFYKSARRAREALEEIAFEIETFALALQDIGRSCTTSGSVDYANNSLLDRCIQTCEKRTKKVIAVVSEMEQLMSRSRSIGRIYVTVKEHDVQMLYNDLERAKSSLAVALTLYYESKRQADAINQGFALSQLSNQVFAIPQSVVHHLQQAESNGQAILGSDCDLSAEWACEKYGQNQRSLQRSRRSGSNDFHLRISLWFSNRILHIAGARACNGWDLKIRIYNVREDNAPIFKCVKKGDLAGVRRLIANGEASPLDRSAQGLTLLELASLVNSVDIMRWLLSQAHFPDLQGLVERAASMHNFVYCYRRDPFNRYPFMRHEATHQELFRVRVEQCDFDPLECYNGRASYDMSSSLLGFSMTGCVDIFLRNLLLPMESIPFEARFDCAMHMDSEDASASDFLRICGLKKVTVELACSGIAVGWTVLHLATEAIFQRLRKGKDLDGWSEMLKQLISMGADLHNTGARVWATPLLQILCWNTTDDLSLESGFKKVRHWVALLQDAGVDLVAYGNEEARLCAEVRDSEWDELHLGRGYSLYNICPHSSPGNWSLEVRPVGELPFFERIRIPGDWVEETIPKSICWQPESDEWSSGLWRSWNRNSGEMVDWRDLRYGRVLFGENQDVEDVIRETQPSAVENVVADTQDDCGVVQLLLMRTRNSISSRRRAASQPPLLRRRAREYYVPGQTAQHGRWFVDFHLCPMDGLHRWGCAHELITASEWCHFDRDRYNVADCIRSWSSVGLPDRSSMLAHPFE